MSAFDADGGSAVKLTRIETDPTWSEAMEAQNLLEAHARRLFDYWTSFQRTYRPWEKLDETMRRSWIELCEYVEQEQGDCPECESELLCVVCQEDRVRGFLADVFINPPRCGDAEVMENRVPDGAD